MRFGSRRNIADGVEDIETRLALRHVEIAIRALTVEPLYTLVEVEQSAAPLPRFRSNLWTCTSSQDVFPFLLVGKFGRRVGGEIRNSGREIRPFCLLPAAHSSLARYRLNFQIAIQTDDKNPAYTFS